MKGIQKYAGYGVITLVGLAVTVAAYARIWEHLQPKQSIPNAVVRGIIPYYARGGDLHLPSSGNKLYIQGEDMPIDFPSKRWDKTVSQGDTVDLVVRRSFPWLGLANELEGIKINDHK